MNSFKQDDIDELCINLKNQSLEVSKIVQRTIHTDIQKLTETYFSYNNNIYNSNFTIEPLPELDMYMNDETCIEIVNYLMKDNKGIRLVADAIKARDPNIYLDYDVISTMIDYYCDNILEGS